MKNATSRPLALGSRMSGVRACIVALLLCISPHHALHISEVNDSHFGSPFVISDVFFSWPELNPVRDRLAYEQFVGDGHWANEPLRQHEVSMFGHQAISWVQTYRQRPFNLFVKPTNGIVNATLQQLRNSIPEVLRQIRSMGPFLSLGAQHQGNPVHRHEAAFFVQLLGSKSWFIQPPNTNANMISKPLRLASHVCEYAEHQKQGNRRVEGEFAYELPEGAAIYVPANWYHSTCNRGVWNVGFTFQGNISVLSAFDLAFVDGDLSSVRRLYQDLSESEAHQSLSLVANADAGPFRLDVLDLLLDIGNRWNFDARFIFGLAADAAEENDVGAVRSLLRAAKMWGYKHEGLENVEL